MRSSSFQTRFVLIGVISIAVCACNPGGTGYYIFKGIWNKKLKSEARIGFYVGSTAETSFDGLFGGPEYLDRSDDAYTSDFESDLQLNLSTVKNVVVAQEAPEFHLEITWLRLNEYHRLETCEGEDFDMAELEVEVEYLLTLSPSGERINAGKASVSESDDLKTKTPEGEAAYCVKRLRSLGFDNLLDRVADKVVAKVTNDIVKYRKKGG